VSKNQGSSAPWFILINDRQFFDTNFLKLPANAAIYWIRLRGQYNPKTEKRDPSGGKIVVKLPYSEAEKVKGYSSKTVVEIIRRLEKYGFIKRTFQGGIYGLANEFSFSGQYAEFPGRKKRGKKRNPGEKKQHYLRIEGEMLRDQEVKRLSPGAFLLWLYLRVEWMQNRKIPGLKLKENQVTMPNFRTGRGRSSSYRSLMRHIEELIEKGYLKRDIRGGCYRNRSIYSFTEKYGSFKDQERRKPEKGVVWY